MSTDSLLVVVVVAVTALLILFFQQRRKRHGISLRPLQGYHTLATQVSRAVESGRRFHFTMGRAPLNSRNNAESIAAAAVLSKLTREASSAGVIPIVSVGDGSLFSLAENSVRVAASGTNQNRGFDPENVQMVSPEEYPFVFGAGVSQIIHHEPVAGSIVLGRIGPELAFITEAGNRTGVEHVLGTSDIEGAAIAISVQPDALVGEEQLASGAYIDETAAHIASLQAQDILRWLAIAGLLLTVVLSILGAGS